jgi:hypothetical protein
VLVVVAGVWALQLLGDSAGVTSFEPRGLGSIDNGRSSRYPRRASLVGRGPMGMFRGSPGSPRWTPFFQVRPWVGARGGLGPTVLPALWVLFLRPSPFLSRLLTDLRLRRPRASFLPRSTDVPARLGSDSAPPWTRARVHQGAPAARTGCCCLEKGPRGTLGSSKGRGGGQ